MSKFQNFYPTPSDNYSTEDEVEIPHRTKIPAGDDRRIVQTETEIQRILEQSIT